MLESLEPQLYSIEEIKPNEEEFLDRLLSNGTRILGHAPRSKMEEEKLSIFLTDLHRFMEKYKTQLENLNGRESYLAYSENILKDCLGFHDFWSKKIKNAEAEGLNSNYTPLMGETLEEIKTHGQNASDFIPAIVNSRYLQDGGKRSRTRRIFGLGEKGTANLKKIAAIGTALALAGAAYYFSVHKPQEETKERINSLIKAGLTREDALNFDKNYKTWAPYDMNEINYAKNLWSPHVTTGQLRQNDALFIKQRYPELLTMPNVLDGDFDGDEIINRTEIFSPYVSLLHLDPLRPNPKITRSITNQAWINDGVSAEERSVIEKLFALYQSQPELAEIVVNSSWFRDGISEEDPYIIEAIHDLKQKIAQQISWMQDSENVYKTRVNDPETLSQIEGKLILLQKENLAHNIIEDKLFVVNYALYGDKKTVIVATFPSAEMRENVLYTTEKIKVGLPKLENFVGHFPYDKLQVWYGFVIGNRGGGGKVLIEDRENYEFRRYKDPKLTPLISPFEAVPYHEIAHTYFHKEGIVQFLDMYMYNVVETNSVLPRDWNYLRGGLYKDESGEVVVKPDTKISGYLALMEIYQLISHDNTSNALKTYYAGAHNETAFVNAFSNHSPENLKSYVSVLASYAYSIQ